LDASKTVTGPTFPRTGTIIIDIAPGILVQNLNISLPFSPQAQVLGAFSITPTPTSLTQPSTLPPSVRSNSIFFANYQSLLGTSSSSDISITYSFFIPQNDNQNQPIISTTGNFVTFIQQPLTVNLVLPTGLDVQLASPKPLTLQPILISISQSKLSVLPMETITTTFSFSISDYFSFRDIIIHGGLPNGYNLTNTDPTFTFGTTVLQLTGLIIPNNFTTKSYQSFNYQTKDLKYSLGPSIFAGPFSGKIDVQYQLQDSYDNSSVYIAQNDLFVTDSLIEGKLLPNSQCCDDYTIVTDSSTTTTLVPSGPITSSIVGIDGIPCLACNAPSIGPGQNVTFQTDYILPSSDYINLSIDGYIPLPLLEVVGSNPNIITILSPPSTFPASKVVQLSSNDTFYNSVSPFSINPIVSYSTQRNTINLNYSNFNNSLNPKTVISFLYTLTVSLNSWQDNFRFIAMFSATEGRTPITHISLTPFYVIQPVFSFIRKGIITITSSVSPVFTPPSNPLQFNSSSCPRFSSNITSDSNFFLFSFFFFLFFLFLFFLFFLFLSLLSFYIPTNQNKIK